MTRKFKNQKRYELDTGESLYMYDTHKAASEAAEKLPRAVIRDTCHRSGFDVLYIWESGELAKMETAKPLFPERLTPKQRAKVAQVYPTVAKE